MGAENRAVSLRELDKIPTRTDLLLLDRPGSPAERSLEKKRIRRHQVLEVVRNRGPISRVEIARHLAYNLPTVSSLVDELVETGLALEEPARHTRLGRRPIPVSLRPGAACVLGVDAGQTHTAGLLMDLGGKVLHRAESPTPPNEDGAFAEKFIDEFLATCAATMPPLAGVGIALRGFIRQRGPGSPYLPHIAALRDRLARKLGVHVFVENDARMMAVGSLWFEKIPDLQTFGVINIGSGLGLGMVIGRKIYEGFHGHAGEIGHLPLGDAGVRCYCGANQCLENRASGSGIERLAAARGLKAGRKPATAKDVFDMARKGNAEARKIVDDFAASLALGISVVLDLFSPQAVILSGRVARSADLFIEQLVAEVRRKTIPTVQQEVDIHVSKLLEDSAPLGACAYVLHHIFSAAHVSLESVL